MVDSLILADDIELLGGGVSSQIPECAGAQFRLGPGWDGGAPVPQLDFTASLALDGEIPIGRRSGNRTITLPVVITAPTRPALIAAREVLMRAVDQPKFTLRWTRDSSTLPTIFDCFRNNNPTTVVRSLPLEIYGIACQVTVSFPAKPYGRSVDPETVDFISPVAGVPAPPNPIVLDNFSSFTLNNWFLSSITASGNSSSAWWDPSQSPALTPTGIGQKAVFTRTGLLLNLAQGWTEAGQGTSLAANYIICTQSSTLLNNVKVGHTFRLWNGGVLKESTIFTVQSISPPAAGFVNVFFTPNATSGVTHSTDSAIQIGPPNLSSLTMWIGLAAYVTRWWHWWGREGGPVRFAFTLTDDLSNTLNFSITKKMTASNDPSTPKWIKMRIVIPFSPTFDYSGVTGWSVTVTNRGTVDMQYSTVYLDDLVAVPAMQLVGSPQRGWIYDLSGLKGNVRAPTSLQVQGVGSQSYTQTFYNPGTFSWTCPVGVTSVNVFAIGPGGGGAPGGASQGGGGGGGGGTAANTAVAVSAGVRYLFHIGKGGIHDGGTPDTTYFAGNSVTVTANGGANNTSGTGTGAAGGAAGTGGFAGGTGGAGVATSSGGGGGGGSSAGDLAAGTVGNAASGSTGGTQNTPPAFGGPGGRGGTFGHGNGVSPTAGFGGGSGGSPAGSSGSYYPGYGGFLQLIYTQTGAMTNLIVHRPSHDAPETLVPFISIPPGDPVNGSAAYLVPAPVPSLNARFDGTYTVVVVANTWDSPSTSRTITVTIDEWTVTLAPTISTQSVSQTFIPNNLPGPFVILGEVTLPGVEIPPENVGAFFEVILTDTDVNDTFYDILFLDSQGSTVMIQTASGNSYTNFWLDEATDLRDIGFILGSQFGRWDAYSVLNQTQVISGGPMTVEPYGNQMLVVYSTNGAPSAELTYFPRWYEDRLE